MRPTDNNRFVYNGYLATAEELTQETKNGPKQLCKFVVESEKLDAEDFPQSVAYEFSTFNRSQIARVMCCANGDPIQIIGYLEGSPKNDGVGYFGNARTSGIKVPEAVQKKATDRLEAEKNKPRASDGLNFNGPEGAPPARTTGAKDDIPF